MQFDEHYKNPTESALEIFGLSEEEVEYVQGRWVYKTAY